MTCTDPQCQSTEGWAPSPFIQTVQVSQFQSNTGSHSLTGDVTDVIPRPLGDYDLTSSSSSVSLWVKAFGVSHYRITHVHVN